MPVRLRHFRSTQNGRGAVALTLALYWGTLPLNTGPLGWKNRAEVETDITNFRAALQGLKFEEAFLPAVAVGQVLVW
jgi:hypothetical protein